MPPQKKAKPPPPSTRKGTKTSASSPVPATPVIKRAARGVMRTRKASQLALSLDTPPTTTTSLRGNTNSTDITRNTRKSKRGLSATTKDSLLVPAAISISLNNRFIDNAAPGFLDKIVENVDGDDEEFTDEYIRTFLGTNNKATTAITLQKDLEKEQSPPAAAVARNNEVASSTANVDGDDEEFYSLDDNTYDDDERKLPARHDNDADDDDISDSNNFDDERKLPARHDDDADDDDVSDSKKRDSDDDDDDFAEMSELDISSDEDDNFVTQQIAGRKRNRGGPTVPKKGSVPDDIYQEAIKARKKFNDQERYKKAKANGSSTENKDPAEFTGVIDDQLRPMSRVKDYRLEKGHTFPSKEILWLRIAEEANLGSKYLTTYRSDAFHLIVFADRFFVGATFIADVGWKMNIVSIRDGDEGLNLKKERQLAAMNIKVNQRKERERLDRERKGKQKENEEKVRNPRTPFHMQWVADIIKPFLAYRGMCSTH